MTTDINGNQYVWNARNQLVQITGANAASFAYDALGRRISKARGSLAGGPLKLLFCLSGDRHSLSPRSTYTQPTEAAGSPP